MITFVYGGSSSGKSAFAEELLLGANAQNKYYLATMSASDPESLKRIQKHRLSREGKGFITLEYPTDVGRAVLEIDSADDSALLLECMSNLVANEMFGKEAMSKAETCASKVLAEVSRLSEETANLIIVSNNIFEDGITYDETTEEYLRALGQVNRELAKMADSAYEVVVGIPLKIK